MEPNGALAEGRPTRVSNGHDTKGQQRNKWTTSDHCARLSDATVTIQASWNCHSKWIWRCLVQEEA